MGLDNGISGCQAENICTVRLGEGVCRPWQFYKGFYGQTVQADDAQYDWNQYARDTAWNRDGNCLCTHAERNPVCEVQEGNTDDFLSAPFCVVGSYRQYCEDGAQ